jgi:arylsulfatase A-like enzyme
MNRRGFLESLGSTTALALLPRFAFGADEPSRRLNFIFILADDLGWADVGCYGGDLHETPNIDRLAAQGMRFTDAYAAGPVCSPTRASIMTGKCPARLHMTIWYEAAANPPRKQKLIPPVAVADLPLEEVTLAETLHRAGYLTAHVGKWHLGDAAHYPETQGFDINVGGTFWGAPSTFFYPYRGRFGSEQELRYVPGLEWGRPGEYLTDRLTDEALKILDKTKDQPFFLNLCHHAVHTPIEGKTAVVDRYKKKIRPDMRHQNEGYAAMVDSLDQSVGRVLARLDEIGIADRTVVVFFSDNGGFINKYKENVVTDNYPLRSGKGALYEGGVRVPLIVRWPGVTKPGSVCREPVSSIDFYPTFLEMTRLSGDPQHNADMDGVSLMPLLKDPTASLKRDALYWHYPHYYPTTGPASSIRQRDWKLIEFFEDNHVELYNLKEDLSEKNDLAAKMPEKADDLRRRLDAWRKTVNAQLPEPNPNFKATTKGTGKGKQKK